jgi:DNA-binding beta-propeller fold protein YncE
LTVRFLAVGGILLGSVALFAAGPGYHVIKKIQIGGEGGWDYLTIDNGNRKLYVSHGTKVDVVDLDSDKVVGEIPDTLGVHGIAIADDLNRGFISDGRANQITIFDLKTFKTIGHAPAQTNPDAICYDPAEQRVFAFNGRSGTATVINAKDGSPAGTIELGGKPEFCAADGRGEMFNNLEDKSELAEIDTKTLKVLSRWPLTGCEGPSGLAIDVEHGRTFSGCHNKVMAIVDTSDGKVLATPPIGAGVDGDGFDPGTGYAFASNGEGTLTIVKERSPGKFEVVENVTTERGARTMAVDPTTHLVYSPAAEFGPMPPATPGQRFRRPPIVNGTFHVLVIGR